MCAADRHHRRSIRLRGYDYTRVGAYYVTICTDDRSCIFGRIVNAASHLSPLGDIVDECWRAIPMHFPHVHVDVHIIMPNHVHGIVVIEGTGGAYVGARDLAPLRDAPPDIQTDTPPDYDSIMVPADERSPNGRPRIIPGSLGAIIQGFKAGVSRNARKRGIAVPQTIWQRNYYDHIVRDAADHDRITKYIADNPANWERDRFR